MLVVLCLLCASCISLGGLYCGYNQLSDEQKQQVKVLETFIENIVADGNIYLVTHEQVAASKLMKTYSSTNIHRGAQLRTVPTLMRWLSYAKRGEVLSF